METYHGGDLWLGMRRACCGNGLLPYQRRRVILVMIVLVILHLIQNLVQNLRGLKRIEVSLFDKDDAMDYIANYCASHNITIKSIEFAETAGAAISDSERSLLTYVYTVLIPRTTSIDRVLLDWNMNQHIISAVDSDHLQNSF